MMMRTDIQGFQGCPLTRCTATFLNVGQSAYLANRPRHVLECGTHLKPKRHVFETHLTRYGVYLARI